MSVRNWLQSNYHLNMTACLRKLYAGLRELSGDAAYEHYLRHWQEHHKDSEPLSRKAFYSQQQQQKWLGINRCC